MSFLSDKMLTCSSTCMAYLCIDQTLVRTWLSLLLKYSNRNRFVHKKRNLTQPLIRPSDRIDCFIVFIDIHWKRVPPWLVSVQLHGLLSRKLVCLTKTLEQKRRNYCIMSVVSRTSIRLTTDGKYSLNIQNSLKNLFMIGYPL